MSDSDTSSSEDEISSQEEKQAQVGGKRKESVPFHEVPISLDVSGTEAVPDAFFTKAHLEMLINRFSRFFSGFRLSKKTDFSSVPENSELRIGVINIKYTSGDKEYAPSFHCIIPIDPDKQEICNNVISLFKYDTSKKAKEAEKGTDRAKHLDPVPLLAIVKFDMTSTNCFITAMERLGATSNDDRSSAHETTVLAAVSALWPNIRVGGKTLLNEKVCKTPEGFLKCRFSIYPAKRGSIHYALLASSVGTSLPNVGKVSTRKVKEPLFSDPATETTFAWWHFVHTTLKSATHGNVAQLVEGAVLPSPITQDPNFVGLVCENADLTKFSIEKGLAWQGIQLLNYKLLESYTGTQPNLVSAIQKYTTHDGSPPTVFLPTTVKIEIGTVIANGMTLQGIELSLLPKGCLWLVLHNKDYYVVYTEEAEGRTVVKGSKKPCLKDLFPWPSSMLPDNDDQFEGWKTSVVEQLGKGNNFKNLIKSLIEYCPEVLYYFVKDKNNKSDRRNLSDLWTQMKVGCIARLEEVLFRKIFNWIDNLKASSHLFILMVSLFSNEYKEYHIFHCDINQGEVIIHVSPWAAAQNRLEFTAKDERLTHNSGYGSDRIW